MGEGTRFDTCDHCGESVEDLESIVEAGRAWCIPCDRPAHGGKP